jgi:hypothetical protein
MASAGRFTTRNYDGGSAMSKDQWVLVKSEGELMAGMQVRADMVSRCGRPYVLRLERPVGPGEWVPLGSWRASVVSACCTVGGHAFRGFFRPDTAIREKRLFRLADHAFESETTSTRARETAGAERVGR